MKSVLAIVISVNIILLFSCKQNKTPISKKSTEDTTVFYPVTNYLKQQIKLVDSTPYFIYHITIRNGKRDSVQINSKQFDSLAMSFIAYDISDSSIKKNYKENVFDDQTTQSYTLTYNTTDSNMTVQNIDVLLNENDQHVKRIFMNTFQNKGDSSITEKMGWKPDRNFYINRIIQYNNGKQITEQNIVVWDDRD